jgi:hypothetical protein
MSPAKMTKVVFRFEWLRLVRSGSLMALSAMTVLAALALSFTLGPDFFPSGMSLGAWFTKAIPTLWYWVGFPICAAIVASQVGGGDISSGSLRLVLVTAGARRSLILGKLGAIAAALLLLSAVFAAIGLGAVLYNGFAGSIEFVGEVAVRFLMGMLAGYCGGMVWPILVCWLAVQLGSHARAGSIAGVILVVGWTARGQFGAVIERYLVPYWGCAMLERPLMMSVPVVITLVLAVLAATRAMQRLEVR